MNSYRFVPLKDIGLTIICAIIRCVLILLPNYKYVTVAVLIKEFQQFYRKTVIILACLDFLQLMSLYCSLTAATTNRQAEFRQ
jgi:hypothetical protein